MKIQIRTGLLAVAAVLLLGSAAAANGLGFGARYTWVNNAETHKGTSMVGVLARLHGGVLGAEGAVDYRKDDLGGGGQRENLAGDRKPAGLSDSSELRTGRAGMV